MLYKKARNSLKILGLGLALSPLVIMSSVASSVKTKVLISSNQFLKKKTKIPTLIENQERFYNTILDSAENPNPSLHIINNASLPFQQSHLATIGELLLKQSLTSIPKTKSNTILQLNSNGYKKRLDPSIYKIKGYWNGKENISEFDATKPLNIFKSSASTYHVKEEDIVDAIDKLNSEFPNTKIDFFATDWLWANDELSDSTKFKIIKNARKIVLFSDGAFQTHSFLPWYKEKLANLEWNESELISALNKIKDGSLNDFGQLESTQFLALKNQITTDKTNISNTLNFFDIYHYDGRYILDKKNIQGIDNPYNVSSFATSYTQYPDKLGISTLKNEFYELFENIFKTNFKQKSDIFDTNAENYDQNKKNIIFIGSSLFSPLLDYQGQISRLEVFPHIKKEIRSVFKKFLEIYNPSKYNVIFKLHPVYADIELAKRYISIISEGLIEKPIIIKSSIPFESLLAWDYNQYKKSKENLENKTTLNFIFKGQTDQDALNNSILFGFQATTSVVHTSKLFIETVFNTIDIQNQNFSNFKNFPIPTLFEITKKRVVDNFFHTFYKSNEQELYKIYKPFTGLNLINLDETISTKNFLNATYEEEKIIFGTLVTFGTLISLSLLVSLGLAIILIRKHLKLKKLKK